MEINFATYANAEPPAGYEIDYDFWHRYDCGCEVHAAFERGGFGQVSVPYIYCPAHNPNK